MPKTIKCPVCQNMVAEGESLCPFCHQPLIFCPQCGAPLQPGQKNCSLCGFQLAGNDLTDYGTQFGATMTLDQSEPDREQALRHFLPALVLVLVLGAALLGALIGSRWHSRDSTAGSDDGASIPAAEVSEAVLSEEKSRADVEEESADETQQLESVEEIRPEIPDVMGFSYESVRAQLLALDEEPVLEYVFSDEINRGCVVSARWSDDSLVVTLSKGLEHTFYAMSKVNGDGSTDYSDLYLVDGQGLHTSADKYDGSGQLVYTFEFEYEDMRETAQYFYTSDGNYHHQWQFEYDKRGRITAEHKYDAEGEEINRMEYQYDPGGRMTQRKDYANGDLVYVWRMTDYASNASVCSYCAHVYGNWSRADIYSPAGEKIRSAVQEFDSRGAVKCLSIRSSNGALIYQYEFESADCSEINDRTAHWREQRRN